MGHALQATRGQAALQETGGQVALQRTGDGEQPEPVAVNSEAGAAQPLRLIETGSGWRLEIRTAWLLAHGVESGTSQIGAGEHPEVIEALISAAAAACPWVQPEDLVRARSVAHLTIAEQGWEQDVIAPPIAIHAIFGLPPGQDVLLRWTPGGLWMVIEPAHLAAIREQNGALPTPGGIALSAVDRLVQFVGLPPNSRVHQRFVAGIETKVAAGVAPLSGEFADADLELLFEAQEYRRSRPRVDAGSAGGEAVAAPGGVVLPQSLTDEERRTVRDFLAELTGTGAADADGTGSAPVEIPPELAARVLALAELPDIERLLAEVLSGGHSAPSGLQRVINVVTLLEVRRTAERLGVDRAEPDQSGERRAPLFPWPVRGRIRNLSGLLVVGGEAQFEFVEEDQQSPFTFPPLVQVHWSARNDAGEVDDETERYSGYAPQDQDPFDLTFDRAGIYDVHALVDHDFHLPNQFHIQVEVKEAEERLAELEQRLPETRLGQTERNAEHTFSDIAESEAVTLGALGAVLGPFGVGAGVLGAWFVEGYETGKRGYGPMDPALAAQGQGAIAGAARLRLQVTRLEQYVELLQGRTGSQNRRELDHARAELDRLRESLNQVREHLDAEDTTTVAARGAFVSRSGQGRTGPLELGCWFTYTPDEDGDGGTFHGHLYDTSYLGKPEDMHFEAEGPTWERTAEALFAELSRSYPGGRVSISFQLLDGNQQPGDRFVRYERVTDTLRGDAKEAAFSTPAQVAVNIVGIVLLVFPPTAAAGTALLMAYNAAQTAANTAEAVRTGTFGTKESVEIGLLALDIIPYLGKAVRLTRRGANAARAAGDVASVADKWVLPSVQFAGSSFMIGLDAMEGLQNLRTQYFDQLTEMCRQERELRVQVSDLLEYNASDPRLDDLQSQLSELQQAIEQTRERAANATAEALQSAAASGALSLAVNYTTGALAARHDRSGSTEPGAAEPASAAGPTRAAESAPGAEAAPPRESAPAAEAAPARESAPAAEPAPATPAAEPAPAPRAAEAAPARESTSTPDPTPESEAPRPQDERTVWGEHVDAAAREPGPTLQTRSSVAGLERSLARWRSQILKDPVLADADRARRLAVVDTMTDQLLALKHRIEAATIAPGEARSELEMLGEDVASNRRALREGLATRDTGQRADWTVDVPVDERVRAWFAEQAADLHGPMHEFARNRTMELLDGLDMLTIQQSPRRSEVRISGSAEMQRDFLDAMDRGALSPEYAAQFHEYLRHIVDSFGSAASAVEAGQLRRLPDGRLWPRDAAGNSWEVHHVIELQYGGADYWGNYLALPRLVHTQLTHIWAAFGRQHRAEIHTAQAGGTQELATAE